MSCATARPPAEAKTAPLSTGPAGFDEWTTRLAAAAAAKDFAGSATAATNLARRWPARLSSLDEHTLARLLGKAHSALSADAALDLLDALYEARWKPSSLDPSGFWRDLVLLLLERNRLERAREVARSVTNPYVLVTMRIDRRFDPAVPTGLDIAAATAAWISGLREAALHAPRSLDSTVALANALTKAGHPSEALQVAEAAIHAATRVGGKPAYADAAGFLPWVLNDRSRALAALGRWEEAVDQLSRARLRPEQGGENVSQTINLGVLLADLDRPRDALDTIALARQTVSGFGHMLIELVRLKSALLLQDFPTASGALAYLRQHESDLPEATQRALVIAGKQDEASAAFIRALEDPATRVDTLLTAQDWAVRWTTRRKAEWSAGWAAMLARPEVRAAILRLGRIEHFELDEP